MSAVSLSWLSDLLGRDATYGGLTIRHLQLVASTCARESITLQEATSEIGLSLSQISRVAADLIELGLVRRQEDPELHIRIRLHPTASGRRLYSKIARHVRPERRNGG